MNTNKVYVDVTAVFSKEGQLKQTALNGDKQLVHIGLVGFPATAELRVG
ncbi:hypothetical protein [Clostridioides difficile]|nr:Uncharacterised protein [Clostridioides difficile]